MNIESELNTLKEEYTILQDHLTNIELKYQTALEKSRNEGTSRNDTAYNYINLQNFVANLFNKPDYSDLLIVLEAGHQIYGHKLILASKSEDCGVTEHLQADILDLTDITYVVAYTMIKWVYTGEINLNMQDDFLIELLQAANNYKYQSLSVRCQKALVSITDINNCAYFYNLADDISAKILKDYCSEFILKNQIAQDADVLANDYGCEDEDCSSSIRPQERRYATRQLKCYYCCKIFPSNQNFNTHNLRHKDDKRFKCQNCGNEYSIRGSLIRHWKENTCGQKKSCTTCGKIFTSLEELKEHKKTEHVNQNVIKCSECGKVFKNGSYLKIHAMVHTGEQPFSCEFCGRCFRHRVSLRKHMQLHTGDKPFICDICGKSFTCAGVLKTHVKFHDTLQKPPVKSFVCDICGKSFTQKGHLNTHEKIHSGEKPHHCNYCEKTFSDSSNFNRHYKVHTGVKPHRCPVCGKSFIQSGELKKHCRRHEKETLR